jgi:hypothetical protein
MSARIFDDLGRWNLGALRAFVGEIHEVVLFVLALKSQSSHAFGRDLVQARSFGRPHAVEQFVVFEPRESHVDVAPVSVETLCDIHTDITLTIAESLQDLEVNRAFQLAAT